MTFGIFSIYQFDLFDKNMKISFSCIFATPTRGMQKCISFFANCYNFLIKSTTDSHNSLNNQGIILARLLQGKEITWGCAPQHG
jgi:hypothetical protein